MSKRNSSMDNSSHATVGGLIRPMTREAAAKHVEAITAIYEKTKLDSWRDWGPADVMMDLPRKWEFSLLLFDSASVVGFLVASVYRSNHVHLHQLSVLHEFRGRGGASSLVRRLIRLSSEKGMSAITLETPPNTEAAQRIYASLGFQVINDVVSVNGYLTDKRKPQKRTGYYPTNREGAKVWRIEIRGQNHDEKSFVS